VSSVALHQQTRRFITGGSSDTWVRVYDYDSEQELEVYKGHHGSIWSVSFSPDGKLYATGSEDGTIKLVCKYLVTLLRLLTLGATVEIHKSTVRAVEVILYKAILKQKSSSSGYGVKKVVAVEYAAV
jgi:WD40 repeat protein